ncbi:MAG: 7,8-didemethyl-8-hydroxy-5-deazariboflavin synthase subunit CofG [Methanothrix sp.]|jgi:FO synthase subunit 1|nr:7,8-didemethyl-8-hydroxy-5-deazariboflavin synthase subunit CofG [Methanothrix sp.]
MQSITYSRNVFLSVTDLCKNHCGYCSFRREIGEAHLLKRREAFRLLARAAEEDCTEALFCLGERPWEVPGFTDLMDDAGVSSLLDYLVELCELALELGLLPHTNAGVLENDALRRLQPYNASMGLMLETVATVPAHDLSPGKHPDVRLDHIARTGRLKIPLTTGILVGIGERWADRERSLMAIADLHRAYGHIQEVIIQPLDPKPGTALADSQAPSMQELCSVVRMARRILPSDVAVQVPPNLVHPLPPVEAGANDLGGLSPVTLDRINPGRPWPSLEVLRACLKGYALVERLPVYPQFIQRGWHGAKTRELVAALAGEDGLRKKKYIC